MKISEQIKRIDPNPKVDAKLIALAGENIGWDLFEYTDTLVRFSVKASVLGDGEVVSISKKGEEWEIASNTKNKILPSFAKNWFNVKKMHDEITMLTEYDSLDKEISSFQPNLISLKPKPWYLEIPLLSIIIVLLHIYVFWMFNQEVRDDAWQAESWVLRDAGAFDRSLYYDEEWWHIVKSFFFDFRPGILYVSVIAVLSLGYVVEKSMPRWFLLLIIMVSSFAGLFWAFDRTLSSIYDTSQSAFAALFGVYIVGLLTRAIYFPFQRVVALSLFIYFGYWSMKSDYFRVVDKHVFLGSWLFGMLGGLCWYLPYQVIKLRKIVAPLAVFVLYLWLAFWVYKTVNHDYLCIEKQKKMAEKIDLYIPYGYNRYRSSDLEERRAELEKAVIKVNDMLDYKTSSAMLEVNISLQNLFKGLIKEYDVLLKETEISYDYDSHSKTTEKLRDLYRAYADAVNKYYEKEHIRLPVIYD